MLQDYLDLGLTQEEINQMCYISPDLTSEDKKKEEPKIKSKQCSKKKRREQCLHWQLSESETGSNCEEDSDGNYFPQLRRYPRGVPGYDKLKPVRGRGSPFNPNPGHNIGLGNSLSIYEAGTCNYSHFNKMQRELEPLLDMQNNAQLRNEAIEQIWNPNSTVAKNNIEVNGGNQFDNLETENSNTEEMQSTFANVGDKQVTNASEDVKATEKTKIYSDVLKNKLNLLILTDSSSSSDSSKRESKDVRTKTAPYIPPYLRKKNEMTSSSDSDTALESVRSPTEKQEEPNDKKKDTFTSAEKPMVKKTTAQLFKNNALISGLLKKQTSAVQFKCPTPSNSTLTTSKLCSPMISSASVISDDSLRTMNSYEDNCSTTDVSSPCITSDWSISASPIGYGNLVDFNDIEDEYSNRSSPFGSQLVQFHKKDYIEACLVQEEEDHPQVPPPPEFEDSNASTYWYYDKELRNHVSYTIPRHSQNEQSTSQNSGPTKPPLISGRRSAFSPFQPRTATGTSGFVSNMNGHHVNPTSTGRNPQEDQTYAFQTRGFWPHPGDDDFPPLP